LNITTPWKSKNYDQTGHDEDDDERLLRFLSQVGDDADDERKIEDKANERIE